MNFVLRTILRSALRDTLRVLSNQELSVSQQRGALSALLVVIANLNRKASHDIAKLLIA